MFAAQLRDAFHAWLIEHKPTYEEICQPKVIAARSKEEVIVTSGEFLHVFSFYDEKEKIMMRISTPVPKNLESKFLIPEVKEALDSRRAEMDDFELFIYRKRFASVIEPVCYPLKHNGNQSICIEVILGNVIQKSDFSYFRGFFCRPVTDYLSSLPNQ